MSEIAGRIVMGTFRLHFSAISLENFCMKAERKNYATKALARIQKRGKTAGRRFCWIALDSPVSWQNNWSILNDNSTIVSRVTQLSTLYSNPPLHQTVKPAQCIKPYVDYILCTTLLDQPSMHRAKLPKEVMLCSRLHIGSCFWVRNKGCACSRYCHYPRCGWYPVWMPRLWSALKGRCWWTEVMRARWWLNRGRLCNRGWTRVLGMEGALACNRGAFHHTIVHDCATVVNWAFYFQEVPATEKNPELYKRNGNRNLKENFTAEIKRRNFQEQTKNSASGTVKKTPQRKSSFWHCF